MLQLVRLVMPDDWEVDEAADQLLEGVDDPQVLRQLCARVQRAQADRPSRVGVRASLTLQEAMRRLGNGACRTWTFDASLAV
ncbi:MAG: hypothetical protein S0880_21000 [Actinomycetota bacterium]|nr:hypothetical protein [Actinomycetota bacterium]